MPGSAGGGHSGGTSPGMSSGGFSGGGHSGGTSPGMSSGGFSGGGMHIGGTHHTPMNDPGYPFNMNDSTGGGNYNRDGKSLLKFLIPFIIIFLIPNIAAIGSIFSNRPYHNYSNSPDPYFEIQEEITRYAAQPAYRKLPEYLCAPFDGSLYYAEDDAYMAKDGIKEIEDAEQHFYEMTGTQPYLIFLNELEGEIDPSYDAVNDYLYNKYISLFGEDEGHSLFLFISDGQEYHSWYILGTEVENHFGDILAERFLDELDLQAENCDIDTDYPEMFASAFIGSADSLMSEGTPIDAINYSLTDNGDGIIVSDINVREKFSNYPDTPYSKEDIIQCHTEKFFADDNDQSVTSTILNTVFIENTGIQPIVILDDENYAETFKNHKETNELLKTTYDKYFHNEDHAIFIISLAEKTPVIKYYTGSAARSYFDSDACETIKEALASADLYDEEKRVTNLVAAFTNSISEISTETYFFYDDGSFTEPETTVPAAETTTGYVTEVVIPDNEEPASIDRSEIQTITAISAAVIIVLITAIVMLKKKRAAHDDENYETHRKEFDYEEKAGFKGLSYEIPVTCKKCGATAFPSENGFCRYCGNKMK